MAIANTIFLFQLFVLRKPKAWLSQNRKATSLPFWIVARHLWPQMLFGIVGFSLIFSGAIVNWVTIAMCLPVFVGPFFAIPFGISSSHQEVGRLVSGFGLWRLPEEQKIPSIIRALHLPAIAIRKRNRSDHLTPISAEDLIDLAAKPETAVIHRQKV